MEYLSTTDLMNCATAICFMIGAPSFVWLYGSRTIPARTLWVVTRVMMVTGFASLVSPEPWKSILLAVTGLAIVSYPTLRLIQAIVGKRTMAHTH